MFQEGNEDEPQLMSFPIAGLKDSHELWQKHMGKVNARKYKEREALKRTQEPKSFESVEVDVSDIDELFRTHGKGPHLLELDFEPTTGEPVSYVNPGGIQGRKWIWKHKYTGVDVTRYCNLSGRKFDTGKLSRDLKKITRKDSNKAYIRAQHILTLNQSKRYQGNSATELEGVSGHSREILLQQQVCPQLDVRVHSSSCLTCCSSFLLLL
jgi:hypothetical protein